MHIQTELNDCSIKGYSQNSNLKSICIYPWLMIGCGIALLSIWPIIHTIALRNVLLVLGGLMGLWYLVQQRRSLFQKPALPLFFILLLFIWVGIQYFLFSRNPGLELEQIKSTWLRTLLACFLGVGIGLFAGHHRRASQIILAGFLQFVIIIYIDYASVSFTEHNWEIPYPFDLGLFGNKISAVFYGIILLALGCGVISYQLFQNSKKDGRILLASIVVIGLTFFSFVIVGTKNGVALGIFLILCLFVIFLVKTNKSFRTISMATFLIFIIGLMSYLHLVLTPGWRNFFPTVAVGIQINKYSNWQDEDAFGLPKLADGTVVPISAYLRTAYATEGLKLILENPLGYGLIDDSFKYLAKEDLANASQSSLVATHSGWIDFCLGLGIPGLLLTWTAIALAFFFSNQQKSLWCYCTRWILVATFLAWMFAEISSKHFIETLFYLISLLSAGNIPVITKESYLDSPVSVDI